MLFTKIIRRQRGKIIKQDEEPQYIKQEVVDFLNETVRELLNLQDINNLGLSEEEKNKHRNIIINKLVKNHLNKVNELSSKFGSDR